MESRLHFRIHAIRLQLNSMQNSDSGSNNSSQVLDSPSDDISSSCLEHNDSIESTHLWSILALIYLLLNNTKCSNFCDNHRDIRTVYSQYCLILLFIITLFKFLLLFFFSIYKFIFYLLLPWQHITGDIFIVVWWYNKIYQLFVFFQNQGNLISSFVYLNW